MTTGTGQAWEARRPQGFWRTFAEADLSKADIIKGFIARYGDVNSKLPERSALKDWQEVQDTLKVAALAYVAPDANGVSHVTTDKALVDHASVLGFPGEGTLHFDVTNEVVRGVGICPRAPSLATFMQMSAVQMIFERTPTRRCDECGHWFALETTRAIYCSAACKSAAHRKMRAA
ncbi:hypothetical protein [Ensifer sp. SSB1]|jgi:hypothetical protein|uniref:hypothetical protein n=1 Tax=Ensifer sp. SSB1 TaxID=2795385 RepID=UPI001A4DA664|nr:hypothetical protein [Ensifer sp. SSB1]MBK5567241.1 hypothetical protein [Ensifer sp. SSB1]